MPDGVRDFGFADAWSLKQTEKVLFELFRRWGYDYVKPPILEFLETVQGGLWDPADLYKLTDHRGRLLALRPDLTIALAHMVSRWSHQNNEPVRLCSSGEVFRFNPRRRGGAREEYQIGVECFGIADAQAEAELLVLATEAMAQTGHTLSSITLGHAGILQALLNAQELDAAAKEELLALLRDRDYVSYQVRISQLPKTPARSILADLVHLKGSDLRRVLGELKDANLQRELSSLDAIAERVDDYGLSLPLRLDLSLVRDFRYYSGSVFELYDASHRDPIIVGGRYDELLSRFGYDTPAVGWVFANLKTGIKRDQPDRIWSNPDRSDYAEILRLRQAGFRVTIQMEEKFEC